MMIASLGGDVGLWPFISQIEGDVKEPTLVLFEMSRESFLGAVVYLSRITHHLYRGIQVGYSKLINGLITAASGALVC